MAGGLGMADLEEILVGILRCVGNVWRTGGGLVERISVAGVGPAEPELRREGVVLAARPVTISNQDLKIGRPNAKGPIETSSRDEIHIPGFLFLGGPWWCGVLGLFAVASGPELVMGGPRGCGARGIFAAAPAAASAAASKPELVVRGFPGCGVRGAFAVARELSWDGSRSSSSSWVALSAIFLGVTGSIAHSAVE